MGDSQPQKAEMTQYGGVPSGASSSTVTLFTVPAGKVAIVDSFNAIYDGGTSGAACQLNIHDPGSGTSWPIWLSSPGGTSAELCDPPQCPFYIRSGFSLQVTSLAGAFSFMASYRYVPQVFLIG